MITIEEMLECHPEASRGELRDGSGTVRYCFEVIRFLLFGGMASRRLAGGMDIHERLSLLSL